MTPRRRQLLAAAAAVALHAAALIPIGLSTAGADIDDAAAPLFLELAPPLPSAAPPNLRARPADGVALAAAEASPLAGQAAAPAVAVPLASPAEPSDDYPGFFKGAAPGCGREDMILLTPEERARCEAADAREVLAVAGADFRRLGQSKMSNRSKPRFFLC